MRVRSSPVRSSPPHVSLPARGRHALVGVLCLACCVARSAVADEGPDTSLPDVLRVGAGTATRLVIHPATVSLDGRDTTWQLVVTGVDDAGGAVDLTRAAAYASSEAEVAAVSGHGVVRAIADGACEVVVTHGELRAVVPVRASGTAADPAINFANDIVPVFSKHGCNSGGCHGKSGGQNGFQLSLFGYVPEIDYRSLTREARGRRVFPAAPAHSLLLRKATGTLPHGGGQRFAVESRDYELLADWMRGGMPWGRPDDPVVTRIEVFPARRALAFGAAQQLAVVAHASDGSARDVTAWAQYSTETPSYVSVNDDGLVRAGDLAGQGTVLVRFRGLVEIFRAVLPSGLDAAEFAFPAERNFIDALVFSRLRALGIPPSGVSSDAVFLRRAHATICGALPTAAEVERFLEDGDPEKRAKLIDALLERPEHASFFALQWADLLRNRRGNEQQRAPMTIRFHRWIYEHLQANTPFDRVVRELICAEGSTEDSPQVYWYQELSSPETIVDDVAQVLLGTRIQCARCHHHPFEKWSQEDYWHFANFFSRLRREEDNVTRDLTITVRSGESRITDNEKTSASYRKTYASLQPPGGELLGERTWEDPRERLADWMLDPSNRLFARAVVNRYWSHFFGAGIVEPVDDMRETNPPSNPELLDALARDFVEHGFDLRHLVRTICNSAAFGLSAEPNEHNRLDTQNFSRYVPRRMPAEALLDAVDRVLATRTTFRNMRRDARAIDLPDETSRDYFLEVFGKPERATACACERSSDVTLSQVLHLLNSNELQDKLASSSARPALLAASEAPEADKVRELFLWTFARPPDDEELRRALEHLDASADGDEGRRDERRRLAWEDLVWALVNSKEFLFIR